jgi:hypothetical protein
MSRLTPLSRRPPGRRSTADLVNDATLIKPRDSLSYTPLRSACAGLSTNNASKDTAPRRFSLDAMTRRT